MGFAYKFRHLLSIAFKPPVFEDEAKTQQTLVLYVNLWFAILAEVLVALMGLVNLEMLVMHAASAAVNALWFSFLLVLTRRGRTLLASWLCLLSIWLMTTAFALVGGGLHAPIISEYLVAIMVAGLLLGWRRGLFTMVASLAACTGFALLEQQGMLATGLVTYTPFSTLLLVTLTFADILMLLALAVYSIHRSYQRAERELVERRQAEKALGEKTDELDRFFNFSIDLLCIADMDGFFRRLNPAWEATLGYSVAELENRRFMDFVHPDDAGPTEEVVGLLSQGQVISGFVNRYRCRDGAYRWIEWQASPHQGSLIFAAARDITERRNAEEERARLDAQIQQSQKLESLGVLAGGIAHDFNNLLAGIVGNADILLADLPEGSPPAQTVEMIVEIAQRASGLCSQLLAYSGKGVIAFEPVDLNRAFLDIEQILEVSISKKAALRATLEEHLPAIEADPTQIRQIMMNLVINAAEALEGRQGEILVSTGIRHCGQEHLRTFQVGSNLPPGEYVCLEVTDTGSGMDEATKARIFDPFFSTKFVGRGLGLAAVMGIVRNHGGALGVDTEPGRGTTFQVLFPPMAAAAQVASPAAPMAVGAWQGLGTVMLVDDESTIRVVGRSLLEKLGFEVIVAEDGRQAVDLYSTHDGCIQCIILDLTMPQMDGEEAFHELRSRNCDVPIIISSGYSEYEVAERFAGKSVAGFLKKPYRMDNLKRLIRGALTS